MLPRAADADYQSNTICWKASHLTQPSMFPNQDEPLVLNSNAILGEVICIDKGWEQSLKLKLLILLHEGEAFDIAS